MHLAYWIISVLVAIALLSLVVKGILFAGWLIGWILIIALGFFVIEEVLEMSWGIGLIVAVLILAALVHYMYG